MQDYIGRYIGTKRVKAKPMTRKEYNDYREWILPDDEDGTDAGMLLEYETELDNHPWTHAGYTYWCPVEIFQRAYKLVQEGNVVDCLINDHEDIMGKVNKLNKFLLSEAFDSVDAQQKKLILEQLIVMQNLARVLTDRIKLLEFK